MMAPLVDGVKTSGGMPTMRAPRGLSRSARGVVLSCCYCWGIAHAVKPVGTQLVFGLGPGLVAVIVLAMVCILICAVGYSAQNKARFVIPVVVIVGGTTLFFASVNIDSHIDTTQKTTKYNRVAITRSAIATIMIAFTVISGFAMLIMHVVTPRQGHLIEDGAGRRSSQARVF